MRAAPAVDAALAGCGRERMLIVALHALAGAYATTWLARLSEWPLWGSVAVAAGAAVATASLGVVLARHVLPAGRCHLRWDGQAWQLQMLQSTPVVRVVVALDLGVWMLLKLHLAGQARTRWCVATPQAAVGAWHGLRVALAAHAGEQPAADAASGGPAA